MEAAEVLAQAKAGPDAPYGWIVLPLLRNKVLWGILGWIFGIIMGFGLFILVALATIPTNYEDGLLPALLSTVFLAILLFIGAGSAWALFVDVRRLQYADRHIIVITPEDFVKQEGDKTIHVPLSSVRYITARGQRPPERTVEKQHVPDSKENMLGFVFGRGLLPSADGWRRKRMRTPTSLAFVDSRTDAEVTVVTDNAYGDPFMIAALLKEYARNVQNIA